MTRSEDKYVFNYLYEMSMLETIEFLFSDVVIDYRDNMIGIQDRTYGYFIAWHGVAKC